MARKCRKCKKELPTAKLSDNWERKGFCNCDCFYEYKPAPKTSTKPKPKKLKSITKLRDEAAILCQKMVKLKAADDNGMCKCWTCGVVKQWHEMQGGHFIERGKAATKIDETNIHPQCPQCNQWGMKNTTTVLAYRDAMAEYYGADYVDELIARSRRPVKHTREWIAEQTEYFKAQIAHHEARLNV